MGSFHKFYEMASFCKRTPNFLRYLDFRMMLGSSHSGKMRFHDIRGNRKVRGWLLSGLRMLTVEWPLAWIIGYAGNTLGESAHLVPGCSGCLIGHGLGLKGPGLKLCSAMEIVSLQEIKCCIEPLAKLDCFCRQK